MVQLRNWIILWTNLLSEAAHIFNQVFSTDDLKKFQGRIEKRNGEESEHIYHKTLKCYKFILDNDLWAVAK